MDAMDLTAGVRFHLDLSQELSAAISPISDAEVERILGIGTYQLNLNNRRISQKSLGLLARVGWKTISVLSLSKCGLRDEDAKLFMESKYMELVLNDNKIGDSGVKALSESFNKRINVEDNAIRDCIVKFIHNRFSGKGIIPMMMQLWIKRNIGRSSVAVFLANQVCTIHWTSMDKKSEFEEFFIDYCGLKLEFKYEEELDFQFARRFTMNNEVDTGSLALTLEQIDYPC